MSNPSHLSSPPEAQRIRTATDAPSLAQAILDNLECVIGRTRELATRHDWYLAMAYTIRDRLLSRWMQTVDLVADRPMRTVCYLSAEFLLGPHLGNALHCLDIYDQARAAVDSLGMSLPSILDQEEEPGLGNGGLGRLAACYLDSLASLQMPGVGYGIRYEFGIFDQTVRDGWQQEITDKWLRYGNPWEIARPEIAYSVGFGGHTEPYTDARGHVRMRWVPAQMVKGVAYDTPIPGYRVPTVGMLRLWKAEAEESFDFASFNTGDYYGAVHEKVVSETISKVLYPNDAATRGKRLRLAQQYFFVSCTLHDMIRVHMRRGCELSTFHEGFAAQLNDTHPAIAVAELMRLLVDEHAMDWDTAWHITRNTFAYTNHTLLPEALEKWPLPLLASSLPRHLEIIYEINHRFLEQVRREHGQNDARDGRISIIEEGETKAVRMAHLASVGSFAINGVAELHSRLLREHVLCDFHKLWPDKFHNVTNGVTPRRWMLLSNPPLARLLTEALGDGWPGRIEEALPRLEPLAEDSEFRKRWRKVKQTNKHRLAELIKQRTGEVIDPDSLLDVQVKRIHEYKRQHLNILHVVSLYQRIRRGELSNQPPRTFIFAGKAAPGYTMAKLIIKLINSVAEVVNADPATRDLLRVVFIPDFNVKNAQPIYPAADLSEQISTAGKEASGTGNMKFALNGALTIGTLDGANVEIREAVGAENFFLFGLTAEEVMRRREGGYRPRAHYDADETLASAINLVASGRFSRGDVHLFSPLIAQLLERDEYFVLADFDAYARCQQAVSAAWHDTEAWTRRSILNTARSGRFSSDRSIRDYVDRIWHVEPIRYTS